MKEEHKEFRCQKCIKYKKMNLFSHYEKSARGKRAVCIPCADKINEAAKKRLADQLKL